LRGVGRIAGAIFDFLLPPICPVCEDSLSEGGVCSDCWDDLLSSLVLEPKTYFGFRVYSLFLYRGRVREAIERMKYKGMFAIVSTFAPSLAEYVREERPDMVVPIPLHPARRRERGFSQTELIARAVASELGIPVVRVLFRRRYTAPQALLDAKGREENLRGAFGCLRPLRGERVLLVDDVITTGNTFYRAASVLVGAGASLVVGGTLARGGPT